MRGRRGAMKCFEECSTHHGLRVAKTLGRRSRSECPRPKAYFIGGRCAAVVIFLIFPHLHARENVSPTLAPTFSRLTAEHFSHVHSTGRICEPTKSCQKWRQLFNPDQLSRTVICPLSVRRAARIAATSLAPCRS